MFHKISWADKYLVPSSSNLPSTRDITWGNTVIFLERTHNPMTVEWFFHELGHAHFVFTLCKRTRHLRIISYHIMWCEITWKTYRVILTAFFILMGTISTSLPLKTVHRILCDPKGRRFYIQQGDKSIKNVQSRESLIIYLSSILISHHVISNDIYYLPFSISNTPFGHSSTDLFTP